MALVTAQPSRRLYLASANPGKLREFVRAAAEFNILVETVPSYTTLPECREDGATFEENARRKAEYYSRHSPGLVFADDSGLCVDALGGAPGVFSARFSGPNATDASNIQKLLAELRRAGTDDRSAHFECVIALAEGGRTLAVFEGRADGVILDPPRGSGGFGYDPCFLYPPLGRTFAELPAQEKYGVSHRGQAFSGLLEYLRSGGRRTRL